PGFLKGHVRRFAQKSHDHRRTPEALLNPGRAVTLVHIEDWNEFSSSDPFPHEDVVWGIACTIDPAYESEVRDYLGTLPDDTLETIDVYGVDSADGKTDKVIIHSVSKFFNSSPSPILIVLEPVSHQHDSWKSVGAYGSNKDYLYDLATAVRRLSPDSHDSDLFALEVSVGLTWMYSF
ncbi:ChaC-like protein, partial [Armillaria fumosa]